MVYTEPAKCRYCGKYPNDERGTSANVSPCVCFEGVTTYHSASSPTDSALELLKLKKKQKKVNYNSLGKRKKRTIFD